MEEPRQRVMVSMPQRLSTDMPGRRSP